MPSQPHYVQEVWGMTHGGQSQTSRDSITRPGRWNFPQFWGFTTGELLVNDYLHVPGKGIAGCFWLLKIWHIFDIMAFEMLQKTPTYHAPNLRVTQGIPKEIVVTRHGVDEGAWRFRFPPHFPRRPLAVTYLKIALAYCLQWYEPLPLRKWQHFNSGWQVKGWYLQALFFDGDSKATCVGIYIYTMYRCLVGKGCLYMGCVYMCSLECC